MYANTDSNVFRWLVYPLIYLALFSLIGCSIPKAPSKLVSARNTDVSVGLEEVSIQAMALVGTPYSYSGNTPDSGFDCSGLVRYVVERSLGLRLPRTVKQIALKSRPLIRGGWAPGDLIFFATVLGEPYSHVGVYIGHGRFVHAPALGGKVRLEEFNKPYWVQRFTEVRRLDTSTSK